LAEVPQPSAHGQKIPADLILVLLWLAVASGAIYLSLPETLPLRVVLALPLMLFIPGYCVIAALFPKDGDINLIERFVLSFGLSIAIVPLIGLGLNFTPWGIRLEPILLSIILFTLVMVLVAYYTRKGLPYEEQFRIHFASSAADIQEGIIPAKKGRFDRILGVVLALAILVTVATAIYIIAVPREGEPFTEFFMLGNNRTAMDYPDTILPGKMYPMFVGVGNHEYRTTRYTIETWMLLTEFDNVTNSSRIRAMDPSDRLSVTLAHNQTMIIPYNFSVNRTGYNRMEFLLFDENVPGFEVTGRDRINASYRDLHLKFEYGEENVENQTPDTSEQTSIRS
jgi:uncharacterized membrane protein